MSKYKDDINDQYLPSVDDLIDSEKNLETVDNLLDNLKEKNLKSIDDYFCEEEDVLEEDIDDNLPSIDDYIEEVIEEEAIEEEVPEEDSIEDLKVLIEEVRNSIPEIPEFKSYDEEILQLLNLIESVQNQIPEPVEVPEIKYYDDDIDLLTERINYIRETILNLPEVRYYEEEIQSIESEVSNLQEKVDELPKVKYYDEDISRLDYKIDDTVDLVDNKINDLSENIDVKFFESKVDIDSSINQKILDLKNSLKKDLDLYEVKILNLKNNNEEDVKFVKKQLKELSKNLDKNFDKKIEDLKEEYTSFNTKFGQYSEEIEKLNSSISNFPKVKYYDEDIKKIQKNVSSIEDSFKVELKELQSIVENIKSEQIELKEGLLNEPPETENKDLLTPTDQKFATLEDLSNHYRVFINRVQQQLSTLGGGGETRLEFLDDVDRDSVKVDGKVLAYNATTGKWIGTTGSAGTQTLNQILGYGNTSNLGMSVGVITATKFVGDGSLLTNIPGSTNSGYANTAGIATYASISGISTYASTAGIATVAQGLSGTPNIIVGIVTATKYYGDGSGLTGIVATGSGVVVQDDGTNVGTAATLNFNNNISVTLSDGIATINAVGGISSTASINTTGIITANSYYIGTTQVINSAGQWVGSGLSVYSNIDAGVPNSVYGGIPVIDGGSP